MCTIPLPTFDVSIQGNGVPCHGDALVARCSRLSSQATMSHEFKSCQTSRDPHPQDNYPRYSIGGRRFYTRWVNPLIVLCRLSIGDDRGDATFRYVRRVTIGTPVRRQPRTTWFPSYGHWSELGVGLGATHLPPCTFYPSGNFSLISGMSPRPSQPGANFSFELTGNWCAALVRSTDISAGFSPLNLRLGRYTKRPRLLVKFGPR